LRGVRPRLPAREGSGVTTCPVAPDSASRHERALKAPRVPLRRTPPSGTEWLRRHHVSYGVRPHLPTRKGSDVATCHAALDPASCYGRALTSPLVLWHQACLPTREGSGVTMCPTASDPPPDMGGLWRRHVSRGIRPCLPAWEGSDVATCHMALGVL
jgi:hypothetical protein